MKTSSNLIIKVQKQFHRSSRFIRPYYYLVVTYSFKASNAAYIEKLGYLDLNGSKKLHCSNLVLFTNRLNYWLNKGAKPNLSTKKLLFNLI